MHWHSLQVVDLAGRDIHIICLATPSENVRPLTFRTGGPAESFWNLLTKNNLDHGDFVAAVKGAFIIREGNKAAAEAAERTHSQQLSRPCRQPADHRRWPERPAIGDTIKINLSPILLLHHNDSAYQHNPHSSAQPAFQHNPHSSTTRIPAQPAFLPHSSTTRIRGFGGGVDVRGGGSDVVVLIFFLKKTLYYAVAKFKLSFNIA